MCNETKAQLIERYEAELRELRAQVSVLAGEVHALHRAERAAKPAAVTPAVITGRGTRPVFEFDANVRGDFARAVLLARQHGGSVRRSQA